MAVRTIATGHTLLLPEHIPQVIRTITSMVLQVLQDDTKSNTDVMRAFTQIMADAAGGAGAAGGVGVAGADD